MITTTLYYREGGSDKVYQCSIASRTAAGHHVTFAFGRRGSTLNTGIKTPQPVTLAEAQKIYDKLIKDKKAKGYTEDTNGTPTPVVMKHPSASADNTIATDIPMLLNSISESEAQGCLLLESWVAQEKHDGKRMTLHSDGKHVTARNKRGLPCGLPQPVIDAMLGLPDSCLIDGECVGDVFHAFDLLECAGKDLRHVKYIDRLDALDAFIADDGGFTPAHLMVSDTAESFDEKTALLKQLRARNAEGIVFKDRHAPWTSGRPNSGGNALKFKFVETASCLTGTAHATKRSVPLILLKGAVKEQVCVGNVTIPPNHTIPPPNSVVEVRYLYAYPGGSLFQPVYLGQRDDVTREECTLSQLKLKAA